MTKQELHNKIKNTDTTTILSVDDFISVYGNDNVKNVGNEKITRANILADRYNLKLEKVNNDYIFSK